jgi:hypothetical protein
MIIWISLKLGDEDICEIVLLVGILFLHPKFFT